MQNAPYSDWELDHKCLPASASAHAWRIPPEIQQLIPAYFQKVLGWSSGVSPVVLRNLDLLDICAGKARITRWAKLAGLRAIAVDREYSSAQDVNTESGFALLIVLLLRMVPGGLMFLACPCSSWVWMSRSQTKRSKVQSLGDVTNAVTAEGNAINERAAFLCFLAWKLGVTWVIEQPASSLFFATKNMASVVSQCTATRVHLRLGD